MKYFLLFLLVALSSGATSIRRVPLPPWTDQSIHVTGDFDGSTIHVFGAVQHDFRIVIPAVLGPTITTRIVLDDGTVLTVTRHDDTGLYWEISVEHAGSNTVSILKTLGQCELGAGCYPTDHAFTSGTSSFVAFVAEPDSVVFYPAAAN